MNTIAHNSFDMHALSTSTDVKAVPETDAEEGKAFYIVTTTLGVVMIGLSIISVAMLVVFNPAW